jgi:type II secretory pathway pseudopilin PulG
MKSQKGITLIALAVTIIVLLILAGIGIGTGINLNEQATKDRQLSELDMVQQGVLEQYTKYKIVKDESKIFGEVQDWSTVQGIIDSINESAKTKVSLKIADYDNDSSVDTIEKYYKLDKAALKKIGITNVGDSTEYIVNYTTGEVINSLEKVTYDGTALYVYAVNKD